MSRFVDVGKFYSNDPFLSDIPNLSLEDCARSCLKQATCASFTYAYPQRDKKCTLFAPGIKRLPATGGYELYVLSDPTTPGLTRAIQPHDTQQPTVDLIVLFTSDALATSSGGAEIRSKYLDVARDFVAKANEAFAETVDYPPLRLIYVGETSFDPKLDAYAAKDVLRDLESPTGRVKLPAGNEGAVQEIHGLRDDLGADLVSVVVGQRVLNEAKAPACGVGDDKVKPSSGFSVVSVHDRCDGYAMAHEVGHNFGLQHNREAIDPVNYAKLPGSNYGYVDKANRFSTLMAYAPPEVLAQLKVLSNPDRKYNGNPRGTSNANNAAAFRRNLPDVANFHEEKPVFLAVPSRLSFTERGEQTVRLYNLGAVGLTDLRAAVLSKAGPFSVDREGSDCVAPAHGLAGTSACSLTVEYEPPDDLVGSGDTLRLSFQVSNLGVKSVDVPLLQDQIFVGPAFQLAGDGLKNLTVDFGEVSIRGTSTVRLLLSNAGDQDSNATTVTITKNAAAFAVWPADGECGSVFTLPLGMSCEVSLRFKSVVPGRQEGELTVRSGSDGTGTLVVRLTGYAYRDL